MKRFVRTFGIAALMLLMSATAWAQAVAQMSGTVRDESGAVLPGVTVTVTRTDTGFTRTTVTEGGGSYVIPNLPTGPYRLEVSLQGFRTYVQTGIVLQVGGTPTINVALAVGNLEETVAVEAAAPLVDVRSAGISEVVENERIVELPLQGRQVTNLIVLAGAAVNTGGISGARNFNSSVAISVAGGLRTGVAYVLDGSTHTDTYDNTNLPFPFPDALQEFSVATSGLSAENGMHSGASVSGVTKSGTNRFSGNVFEFLRHHRFNATDAFAPIGANGKRADDGLVRNQFGGTLGGPIIKEKLFFFGGYQGTRTRQTPASFVAFVPTAAMVAGDFTAIASPACNQGRSVTLRAPFVNNRIDPALLSPAAMKVIKSGYLPSSNDPCGEIRYSIPLDNNDGQSVARADYQWSANHSVFGRYMDTIEHRLPTFSRTHNVLTVQASLGSNKHARAQSTAFGDTRVFGANMVNAFRATWNRTSLSINDPVDKFFDASDLGIKLYTYVPGHIGLNVTNGFAFGANGAVKVKLFDDTYQLADDLSVVRGRHQMSFGVTVSHWQSDQEDNAKAAGEFLFNGQATGLGLADFLTGQTSLVRHAAAGRVHMNQWYQGVYAGDTWKAADRVTLNMGLRWEPYFGQTIENGAISNFSLENFRKGIKSTRFLNAPAGLLYPGDPGFGGSKGMKTKWWNLSPRVGVAWDVTGDGRTAIRSSYAVNYEIPTAQFLFIAVQNSPFSNLVELQAVPFDDPYRSVPGGDTNPVALVPAVDARFPATAGFGVMDADINSPRVQSWNVTIERQIGTAWQVSASYLGNHADRLWWQVHINPGKFMGLGPCTIAGVSYPVCTTPANLDQRRTLYLENPVEGRRYGSLVRYTDVGTQAYGGLKLSFRRRAASGISLSGNYTLSHCESDTDFSGSFAQYIMGYSKPDDPSFDRGNCSQNRRQIANLSLGVQTPRFGNAALRAVASDWRMSGIFSARSGSWLSVITSRDIAAIGVDRQRVNQVNDNPYGDKSLTKYLNPAAFAFPDPGTWGNQRANSIEGPAFQTVDLALSRLVALSAAQKLEFRVEVFNVFNTFNWGNPNTTLDAATFGRITARSGEPRVMQFGFKYGF